MRESVPDVKLTNNLNRRPFKEVRREAKGGKVKPRRVGAETRQEGDCSGYSVRKEVEVEEEDDDDDDEV